MAKIRSHVQTVQTEQKPRLGALSRLGAYGIWVLVLGILGPLAALGFLLFLWIESHKAIQQGGAQRLWSTINSSGWMVRSITLSSIAIRIGLAAQAGVATALLAALLVEKRGAKAKYLAEISIMRAVASGPHNFVWATIDSLGVGPLYSLLAVVLLLTTFASQFSSTILLTDVGTATIVQNDTYSNDDQIAFAYSNHWDAGKQVIDRARGFPVQGTDVFRSAPQFPRFGELHLPPWQSEGIRDTGFTRRAFLPHSNASRRTSLRYYAGPATVINSQVVCVRPVIKSFNITDRSVNSDQMAVLDVAFDTSLAYGRAGIVETQEPASWDQPLGLRTYRIVCPVPLNKPYNSSMYRESSDEWYMTLCPWGWKRMVELNSVPVTNWWDLRTQGPDSRWLFNSSGYSSHLFFNWSNSDYSTVVNDSFSTWKPTNLGEWVELRHRDGAAAVNVTLCITAPLDFNYRVEMSDGGGGSIGDTPVEPTAVWDQEQNFFSMDSVLRQLGAFGGDTSARGILTMRPIDELRDNLTFAKTQAGLQRTVQTFMYESVIKQAIDPGWASYADSSLPGAGQYLALSQAAPAGFSGTHRLYVAVAQRIMKATGNPALAIQAIFTMAAGAVYSDLRQYFDILAPASSSSVVDALIPRAWTGLAVVAALIALHIVVVAATTVLFVVGTKSSVIGNSWQAVSQTVSDDTKAIIEQASDRDSSSLRRWLKDNNSADSLFIVRRDGDGRSTARFRSGYSVN